MPLGHFQKSTHLHLCVLFFFFLPSPFRVHPSCHFSFLHNNFFIILLSSAFPTSVLIYLMFLSLASSLAWVQTGERTDSHSPFLSPCTTTSTQTHTHISTSCVCVSSCPVCIHIHSHQQMVERWGCQGFCTCPAKQCSLVIWPVRGE